MAEISPSTETPTVPAPTQLTPEGALVSTIIAESKKSDDPPRETLSKIARLKQAGGMALTGLLVISTVAQLLGREAERNG